MNTFVCASCKENKDITEMSSGTAGEKGIFMWCFDCDEPKPEELN